MSTTISQRELRNGSGAIMRRVEQGEIFTVTRNGTAIADLVPHSSVDDVRRTRFLPVAEIAAGLAALPPWGVDQLADEFRELDRTVDDRDVDPWTAG